ncbi:MFS transporter [Pseudooceanicola algae]|uniref:Major facilitator superfamily (MFS) profile domain-containing protein n=1 Tax=Pseudooceanicola algae TaxID=1537215 RepID=A0A418SAY5_9RHOB|nr:MFS transporter [Pseudooceanicola algae]QPM91230.1 hypothetical protein PSAL_024810 [Pseudooceanicola algae]
MPGVTTLVRVLVIFVAGLGASGQFAKIAVLFPAWAAAYPQAGAGLGFLLSLISLLGVVLGLVAGMVVARAGFRRALIWSLLLGALLSGLESLMPPLPVMMGLRAMEGLSHLVLVVACPTMMAEITSDRARPLAMTLWSTYFGVSFVLFALAGPPLLSLAGIPAVLLAHAGWMLAMALLVRIALPDDRATAQTDGTTAHPGAPLSLGLVLKRHAQAYSSPFIAAPGIGWFCYAVSYVAYLTVIPPFLPEAYRTTLIAILPILGILVSLTLSAALLRRLSAVTVAVMGFAGAALSLLCLAAWPGAAWPSVALFCTMGLMQSGGFASVPQINHALADRALSNGSLAQMGNLGNLIGTPVLLALTASFGQSGLIWFGLCAYGAGIVTHLIAARMRARRQMA